MESSRTPPERKLRTQLLTISHQADRVQQWRGSQLDRGDRKIATSVPKANDHQCHVVFSMASIPARSVFGSCVLLIAAPQYLDAAKPQVEHHSQVAEDSNNDELSVQNQSDHWAYQPVVRPPLPSVCDSAWPKNPIDYFVLSRLERENLHPSPPADPFVFFATTNNRRNTSAV